jgi:site-specific DNA recombinase
MVAHPQPLPGAIKRRCAIYTRKSHEEGLEQEYNSLDAQRDSGLTYVASQKHEGWVALPTKYDDGGYTGSNMDRPALRQLLADIEAGKVDVVVVYKIDRLSRSLNDFVSLLQTFERKGVAFVSVTQQFNTANPMGRLILNILICFAQFERENIAERIRDKMAASRKRGKWVGGVPPLGYDVDYAAKKLVVNEAEAEVVRRIFTRFSQCGSPAIIADELRADGITTKAWTSKTGKVHPGEPFNRAYIYKVLHQRTYLGEVAYNGGVYPGEHMAILDRPLWDRVHTMLAENPISRANKERGRQSVPGFLKGIVRCAHCGSAMTMAYTKKRGGPTYRYYRCLSVTKGKGEGCPVTQVPAGDLEAEVLKHLRRAFRAPAVIAAVSSQAQKAGAEHDLRLDHAAVLQAMRSLDEVWDELFPGEQERVVGELADSLEVGLDHSTLKLRLHGIGGLAGELRGLAGVTVADDGSVAAIRLGLAARRRCGRTRMVAPQPAQKDEIPEPDALLAAMARAFRWQEQIESGAVASVSALAEREGVDEAYIRRQLRLALQPPEVVARMADRAGAAVEGSIRATTKGEGDGGW